MKVCFIPLDNRPVCYNLAKDIANIDKDVVFHIPPRDLLGDLTKNADTEKIFEWLNNIQEIDVTILSLDTIAYGGLIPSRRSNETLEEIKNRIFEFKKILEKKHSKIYAFSSIMRISNNNYNEEEKIYWDKYGKKIFDYSYMCHKNGGSFGFESCIEKLIPDSILDDYMLTRKRNFEINKIYLDWEKEGFLEYLIYSKDDCAEFGFNVMEALELEKIGARIKTGADEIPVALLSKALYSSRNKVFPVFIEENYKNAISNYEDISIEKSVLGQLEISGFDVAKSKEEADLILIINNFIEKQGEYVMGWSTEEFHKKFIPPEKPYAIADVRFANGSDNKFVQQLLDQMDLKNFYGYSGWNTSANTIGSLLACAKTKLNAKNFNPEAFKKLQAIRLLDDWAYQANIRKDLSELIDIKEKMQPYENKISSALNFNLSNTKYTYPWNRKFEIEINL